ncbi:hypothetical protein AAHH80_40650, partial [Burkholderia pseudomallei]
MGGVVFVLDCDVVCVLLSVGVVVVIEGVVVVLVLVSVSICVAIYRVLCWRIGGLQGVRLFVSVDVNV